MENHFERVLATEAAPKRPADFTSSSPITKRTCVSHEANDINISAIVDAAEAQEGDALDARSLKTMANTVKKHVRRNALDREKYADEPNKFLESELALDRELTRWKQVAAKPELFAVMIELQVPRLLLGLFAHENLDIRLTVLSLLADLTDVDDATESLEPARNLAQHLVDEKLLPLLITNLFQLAAVADEGKEGDQVKEEMTGIYNSLQILENLADLEPQVCVEVVDKTAVLPFLLKQVAPGRDFSDNKLYASEILSILLQSGAKPREKFVAWTGKEWPNEEQRIVTKSEKKSKVNLMDDLLQALAPYRKKDPASDEEEELVGNLVNALCSVLLVPEAQTQFRRLEGLELLLRFMKDRKRFMFSGALCGMDHALMGNARNCERLIEIGGLRTIFSVFMGRHSKYESTSITKASKASKHAKEEENVVSLIASLCAWVCENAPVDGYDRLHAKFVENDMEKIDRLVDLFVKYHERVERSSHLYENEDEEEDEDSYYLRRLDAGLFVLERIAFVVAHLCHFSKKVASLHLLVADEAVENNYDGANANEAKAVVDSTTVEAQKLQLRQLLETLEAEIIQDGNVSTEEMEAGLNQKMEKKDDEADSDESVASLSIK
ncbi:unnamed protein product [Peronospora belbahrii]|uniref:Beta-catenin-like protein 1 N-terminal domain-containing protein n=1 Tax=Peronospora belbahrii TaxID=622444 RepID=A0AAU9L5P9_9STRA|nr:unnamed protein product [Peronospora belbahrii]